VPAATSGARSDRGCLFCLQSDGGFTSEEHAIPESLGNTEFVLPRGIVCDRCNQRQLATLDQRLLEFMPLKMRRTTLGIPNKDGKVPTTKFQDTQLEIVEGRPALTGPAPRTWQFEEVDPRDPRWSVGTATLTGGRPLRGAYAAEISRALLKVGFEAAWTKLGDRLMEEDFDDLRTLILVERSQPGYIFMVTRHLDQGHGGRDLDVRFTVRIDPENGRANLYVAAKMLGVYMATDSFRATPPPNLTAELGYTASF
jgi:hypothetical protein